MASNPRGKNKATVAKPESATGKKRRGAMKHGFMEGKPTPEQTKNEEVTEATAPIADEAKAFPADEEEALFLGFDRESPPLPDELASVTIEANSVWQALLKPPKPPTHAALRALKDCDRRIKQ